LIWRVSRCYGKCSNEFHKSEETPHVPAVLNLTGWSGVNFKVCYHTQIGLENSDYVGWSKQSHEILSLISLSDLPRARSQIQIQVVEKKRSWYRLLFLHLLDKRTRILNRVAPPLLCKVIPGICSLHDFADFALPIVCQIHTMDEVLNLKTGL
jgi:hypothetical protein